MRALFVMDPLSTIKVDKDSSYALMLAWQERGGEVWHCGPGDLWSIGDHVYARASRITAGPRASWVALAAFMLSWIARRRAPRSGSFVCSEVKTFDSSLPTQRPPPPASPTPTGTVATRGRSGVTPSSPS